MIYHVIVSLYIARPFTCSPNYARCTYASCSYSCSINQTAVFLNLHLIAILAGNHWPVNDMKICLEIEIVLIQN